MIPNFSADAVVLFEWTLLELSVDKTDQLIGAANDAPSTAQESFLHCRR